MSARFTGRGMSLRDVGWARDSGRITDRDYKRYFRAWLWSAPRFGDWAEPRFERYYVRCGLGGLQARRERVLRALRAVGAVGRYGTNLGPTGALSARGGAS
jgi:hypothetical protein